MHLPTEEIDEGRRAAPIGHMLQVNTSHHLEKLSVDVRRATISTRGHVDLSWIRFGIRDELRKSQCWHRRMHNHYTRYSHDGCYRDNIPNEIEIKITVQRCIDRVSSRDLQKRISIRRRLGHRFCSEVTSSANSVFNNELLTEPF